MAINFPDSPSTGNTFTAGGQTWKWDGTKWIVASQGGVNGDGVNILRRNGGFEVWQRGAGGSAVITAPAGPAATYGPDGWYLYTSANQLSTMTQSGPVAVTGSKFSCGISRNAGQTGVANMIFGFPLDTDELAPMLGKFVRLSFRTVAGASFSPASGNITAYLVVGTGTPTKQSNGFTGQTFPLQQTISVPAGGGAQAIEINSSVVVPSTTNQAEVLFLWTPVGTAGAADTVFIDDVQLEIVPAATGYVASPFQRLNFEEQLALCMRHYQKTQPYSAAPTWSVSGGIPGVQVAAGASSVYVPYNFPVPMRISPVGAAWNPAAANQQIRNLSGNYDCSSTSVGVIGPNSCYINGLGNASAGVGNLVGVNVTLEAGI